MATRQAAKLLGYRVTAIDQTCSSHFSLRFDTPVESSRTLVGGNSAAPPKGWQILPFLPLSASALRGLSSIYIYAIYRGRGLGLGVAFGFGFGLETGFVSSR